ncbi:MAG TPA: hypothetical protein VK211_23805 [Kamptonema sp.]|nr:hypothetical protein [Kamptonema sp.]
MFYFQHFVWGLALIANSAIHPVPLNLQQIDNRFSYYCFAIDHDWGDPFFFANVDRIHDSPFSEQEKVDLINVESAIYQHAKSECFSSH